MADRAILPQWLGHSVSDWARVPNCNALKTGSNRDSVALEDTQEGLYRGRVRECDGKMQGQWGRWAGASEHFVYSSW